MDPSRDHGKTFEETYPRYPFAELVRLSLLPDKRFAEVRSILDERSDSLATQHRPDRQWLSPR